MRRHTDVYSQLVAFPNLLRAGQLAQRGKRFKLTTARFNFFLEQELVRLQRELVEHTYRPGRYHHFTIYEPKQRVISAAPYRDRVVHHALHNVLEPLFDPTFIYDSYATRKEKGTHARYSSPPLMGGDSGEGGRWYASRIVCSTPSMLVKMSLSQKRTTRNPCYAQSVGNQCGRFPRWGRKITSPQKKSALRRRKCFCKG